MTEPDDAQASPKADARALLREASRCAKCGKCRSVCPIFLETGDESAVARGRITLAEAVIDGRLELTDKVKAYMWTCLKCLRCSAVCPSGVAYEMILQGMRDQIAVQRGVPWLARVIFNVVLPRRWLFDTIMRLGQLSQRVLPLRREGLVRHLPLAFLGHQSIPALERRTALKLLRGHEPKGGRPKVGLFLGCLTNYVYPRVALALIDVFDRAGYDVVTPPSQVCCGTPVLAFGATAAGQRLAATNVAAFADCDAIVTGCASCSRTLKCDYEGLLGEPGRALSERVFDASEFLAKEGAIEKLRPSAGSPQAPAGTVTYHDPCHLNFGQGITQPPRQLIETAAELVEMAEPDRCCGGAGAFSLFHYDYACQIAAHKVDMIARTGAAVVATTCPGCMLHLADRLHAAGSDVQVKHTLEVAASREPAPADAAPHDATRTTRTTRTTRH